MRLIADGANNLPGGFDDDTQYYIINTAADTFQLSLTSGGSAVSVTSDGQGSVGVDYLVSVTVTTSNSQILIGEGWCLLRD